ncbi:MAG TPA: ATP-binding cassette domain-containing protein [Bryobacteraceae bacterium]|jgi:tungstate transport system ATP-binding protein
MNLRTPASDLPIVFTEVGILAGRVAILDQVSINVSPGAPTVLIGPNGSGKTTFLLAAMGLITPSRGRITWNSRERSPPTRRAIVFQRPVMLRRSVAGNIGYALSAAGVPRAERGQRTAELLSLVGLQGLEARPARRLSGGEQQRLSLARALARDPAVLFLDEPTASLDPAATRTIEDIVRTISARGVKVVMATHDLGEAKRLAGGIVLMHRGRVIESGAADAFFAGPTTDDGRRFIAGELLV